MLGVLGVLGVLSRLQIQQMQEQRFVPDGKMQTPEGLRSSGPCD